MDTQDDERRKALHQIDAGEPVGAIVLTDLQEAGLVEVITSTFTDGTGGHPEPVAITVEGRRLLEEQ